MHQINRSCKTKLYGFKIPFISLTVERLLVSRRMSHTRLANKTMDAYEVNNQ